MLYDKGVFLFDVEVELAWGHTGGEMSEVKLRMREASMNVRNRLNDVLLLLDKYQIPATFGILGHAALDHCEGSGLPHADMPRPSYSWLTGDWYSHDPCKTLAEEPAFYGRDIVDRIVNWVSRSELPNDVACHSFSHQLFGDPGCTEDVADAEVKKCLKIMKENYGIRPRVFIFPRDFPGHLKVLKRNGFIGFRGPIPHFITYSESPIGVANTMMKYASLASYWGSFYLSMPPPVVQHSIQEGLLNVPASMCYNKKPFVPLRLVRSKATKGIDRAVKEKRIFHLYTHLINFGEAPDIKGFLGSFEDILAHVDSFRKQNRLVVTTIRQLAESTIKV